MEMVSARFTNLNTSAVVLTAAGAHELPNVAFGLLTTLLLCFQLLLICIVGLEVLGGTKWLVSQQGHLNFP